MCRRSRAASSGTGVSVNALLEPEMLFSPTLSVARSENSALKMSMDGLQNLFPPPKIDLRRIEYVPGHIRVLFGRPQKGMSQHE